MALVKVLYVGPSDVREIRPADVKPKNVVLDHKLVWNRDNGFSLVVDANERLIEVLREQEHFTISEVTDNGDTGAVVAKATDPNHQETVVAAEEGKPTQKSVAK